MVIGIDDIYALWRRIKEEPENEVDDFLREFCKEKQQIDIMGRSSDTPVACLFLERLRKI